MPEKEVLETKEEKNFVPAKPSDSLYKFAAPLARAFVKLKFNAKFDKDPRIAERKGPFVCIGTHSWHLDVVMMLLGMNMPLNIVCGRDVFTWSKIKPFREKLGLIPINQFEIDLASIRSMKRAVDSGLSLAIFPEGKFSLDGRNLYHLSESVAKLLKLLNADVVFVHNYGGYSANPRWYKGFKKGPVTSKSELLFTREELKTLTKEQIYAVLKEKFTFNDNIYQAENHLRYKCKDPALGLQYILYKCPKCGTEYETVTDARHLKCEQCGNTVEYTEYGELRAEDGSVTFPRIDLWYEYEREEARKELERDDFSLSYAAAWAEESDAHEYVDMGDGEFYINKEYIGFRGKRYNNGEDVVIQVPLAQQPTIVHKNYEAIDLTVNNKVNRFYFKDVRYSAKFNILVEESYRKLNNIPIE